MSAIRKYINEFMGFPRHSLSGVTTYYQGKQTSSPHPDMSYNKKGYLYEFYPGYYFTQDRDLAKTQAGADGEIVSARIHFKREIEGNPIKEEVKHLLLHSPHPNYEEEYGGFSNAVSEYMRTSDRVNCYLYLYQNNYKGDYNSFFKELGKFGYNFVVTEEYNRTSGEFIVVFNKHDFTVLDVESSKI